jgi:ASPIC and UnbV
LSELAGTIGLGNASQVDGLEVIWPKGGRQFVNQPRIDGLTIIEQEPTR